MSIARILLVVVVAGGLLFGIHYYFWARLVRDPMLPDPWSTIAGRGIAVLGVSIIVGLLASRALPRAVASPFLWIVFTWMGVMFFLFVLLGTTDVFRLVVAVVRRVAGEAPLDPTRRTFIARLIGGSVGLATLGLSAVALQEALREVRVKHVTVPLAKLSPRLNGYTIVQLTDIHVGPTIGKDFIERLVTQVNALDPGCVVITGDLVDGSVAELGALVAPLSKLRARDGVFFVTGNHEYYSGVLEWMEFLPTLGIRVLHNEHVSIGGEGGFDLAGVDDWTAAQFGHGHGPDLPRALDGRDTSRALVLLAHQPKQILSAEPLGVDLQLSGHTHAGQLFPFNYAVRLQQPYIGGLYQHGRAAIYVSAGTGYWGPPMRLGAPAEITRVELLSDRSVIET